MRRLTLKEVQEHHGGILPPDAVFRPDDDELPPSPPPTPMATTTKPKRRTRSERFTVLNAFVDMGLANLTGAETKVWLILFRDTKGNGIARTAQTDIARRARLSVRSVKLALRNLTANGMVRLVHRGRLNVGPSVYRVHPTGTHSVRPCPVASGHLTPGTEDASVPYPRMDQCTADAVRSGVARIE